MVRNATNKLLQNAKKLKSDEFYTQLSDIESELQHYKSHFENKVVYCNCDDPRISNFFKYFAANFKKLGLKKIITSCYREQVRDLFNTEEDEKGFFFEYTGTEKEKNKPISPDIVYFNGDGDFRSPESIELLKKSDIVVTNPPFSLFREYVHFQQILETHLPLIIDIKLDQDIEDDLAQTSHKFRGAIQKFLKNKKKAKLSYPDKKSYDFALHELVMRKEYTPSTPLKLVRIR